MATLTTKTRGQGSSVVTTLPGEVVRRLGIGPGETLTWVEDGMGGFHVSPRGPQDERFLDANERMMARYAAVFRKLAE